MTQRILHRSGGYRGPSVYGSSRGFHPEGLVRPPGVEELDPVAEDAGSVPLRLKAVAVQALLLQGPDLALHHPVLLWAVWGDELLAQAAAARHPCLQPHREAQAVI